MDNFRLILLIVGVLLVVGVFFVSRKKAGFRRLSIDDDPQAGLRDNLPPYKKSSEQYFSNRHSSLTRLVRTSHPHKASLSGAVAAESKLEPLNVLVYVMAEPGTYFRRAVLIESLQRLGYSREADDEFAYFVHEKSIDNRRVRLFSVRDIQEPGIFEDEDNDNATTLGLALELELPLAIDSMDAFEKMLTMARVLAAKTNGVVCDDLQNRLTNQATMHIKDKIMDFQRKLVLNQSLQMRQ